MSLETDLLLDRRRLKRRLTFWRVLSVLAVFACVVLAVGRAGMGVDASRLPASLRGPLGALAPARVARLTVDGLILDDRQRVADIRALADDPSVRALIVAVDSPGGTVAGGEALHGAIAKVAAAKPVVAVMSGTAASAGYMIALPAGRIFARASTLTGSIGVILQTGEASGLLDRIGVTTEAIVSGPLKGQPTPTKPLTEEARTALHGLVDDMFDQFVAKVVAGRHLDEAKVRQLADGRAYTGRQALGLGLVDAIGGEPEARAWLAEKGVPDSVPVRDVGGRDWTNGAFSAAFNGVVGAILPSLAGRPVDGALAVWQPR